MRILLKPKWIAGHLLALAVIVAFVNLGLWQRDRHEWRADLNSAIRSGLEVEAEPLERLEQGRRDYRRTVVRGRYAPEREVLHTPRNERGPGHHVLTPLELSDGSSLVVDRGWIPFRLDTPPIQVAAPPAGEVVLSGILLPATAVDARATRADDGRLLRVAAVSPSLVAGERAVADVYLLLHEQSPRQRELPVPGPLPKLESGPHLSYMAQWFLFALVVAVGYPLLLRRTVRDAASG